MPILQEVKEDNSEQIPRVVISETFGDFSENNFIVLGDKVRDKVYFQDSRRDWEERIMASMNVNYSFKKFDSKRNENVGSGRVKK